jgi:thiol-disulfide isomerase/thioredoxin
VKKIINFVLATMLLISLTACGETGGIEASKTKFPDIVGTDMEGNTVSNDIFSNYDATIVNFWSNGCGTCIAEMPELEDYYQEFSDENINFIGVGADSGESEEALAFARKVLSEKNVTYMNISPDIKGSFYGEYIPTLTGFPTTYVVDSDGNIIGNAIIGNVKAQDDTLRKRLELVKQ